MKILLRSFSLICILLLSVFSKQDTQSEYNVPITATSVFAIDLDLDGSNDIIVGHQTTWGDSNKTISILRNDGYGTFEITDTSKTFCGNQWHIFAVDLNGDIYPDIVALHGEYSTGIMHRFIRVYYNTSGTFSNSNYIDFAVNTSPSENIDDITYGDINGDGYIDLVFISEYGQFWGVLYNDGTGHFSSPEYHSIPGVYPLSIACGDLNNDGRDDIVICGQSIRVELSYSSGFQEIVFSKFAQDVRIKDFEGDDNKDIICYAVVSIYNYTDLFIFKNNGDGTFTQLPDYYYNYAIRNFSCTDFNNDGYPDMLFQLEDISGYVIYYNQGNFSLADSQFVSVPNYNGEGWRNCYCADLDNNGFNDIITVYCAFGQIQANLDIQFNDGHGHFTPDPIVGIPVQKKQNECLFTNWPNPFRNETTFNFNLKETAQVDISVFDIQGKLITTLIYQKMKEGFQSIKWYGLDNGGHTCKLGIYFCHLTLNSEIYYSLKLFHIE